MDGRVIVQHERIDDMPIYLKWGLTVFNRVGFPVIVCAWLAYQQFISGKELTKAVQDFKEVMTQVRDTLEQQNRLLRRSHKGMTDGV